MQVSSQIPPTPVCRAVFALSASFCAALADDAGYLLGYKLESVAVLAA
jgi:hypothetical protein